MKKLILIHLYLLIALAACTQTQEPLPLLLPVAQVEATETATATTVPTDMSPTSTFAPPLSTWTVTPFPSRTPAPPPPTATDGPSPTPVPTTTNTPGPSPTPWPTWPPPPPAVTPAEPQPPLPDGPPFTDGMIAILWNPDFEEYNRVETYQLDFAIPGETPDEWVIQTALTGLTSRDMFPSPDGQKFVLAQFQDTNGDGYVPSLRGGDTHDLFLYTKTDGSLIRLTDDQILHYPEANWLPDSNAFTYPNDRDLWLVELDNPTSELLFDNPDYRIRGHAWSPDGRLLAVHTHGVDETTTPGFDNLSIYNTDTGELVRVLENSDDVLDLRWSPDSQWLFVVYKNLKRLFLMDAVSFEFTEIALPDSRIIMPEWAFDSQSLAIVYDYSSINLLEISSKSLVEFAYEAEDVLIDSFVWSPDSLKVAAIVWDEDRVNLVVINREDGSSRTLISIDQVDMNERPYGLEGLSEMQLLTWSPDGQWILIFVEQKENPGLYIVDYDSGSAHLVLETSVRQFFTQDYSNDVIDRTRHVAWVLNSTR